MLLKYKMNHNTMRQKITLSRKKMEKHRINVVNLGTQFIAKMVIIRYNSIVQKRHTTDLTLNVISLVVFSLLSN